MAQQKPQDLALTLVERLTPSLQALTETDPERVKTLLVSEFAKNADLPKCHPASLSRCIIESAKLNLELGSHLGQAYLIPFKGQATLIIGYRGLRELVLRSGAVTNIYAETVHQKDGKGDIFDVELGIGRTIKHKPDYTIPRNWDTLVAVYAVAEMADGAPHFEVMPKEIIAGIRARALSQKGPWSTDTLEMVRKTVVRRICKQLPQSVVDRRVYEAVNMDERAEYAPSHQWDDSPIDIPAHEVNSGRDQIDDLLGTGGNADSEPEPTPPDETEPTPPHSTPKPSPTGKGTPDRPKQETKPTAAPSRSAASPASGTSKDAAAEAPTVDKDALYQSVTAKIEQVASIDIDRFNAFNEEFPHAWPAQKQCPDDLTVKAMKKAEQWLDRAIDALDDGAGE